MPVQTLLVVTPVSLWAVAPSPEIPVAAAAKDTTIDQERVRSRSPSRNPAASTNASACLVACMMCQPAWPASGCPSVTPHQSGHPRQAAVCTPPTSSTGASQLATRGFGVYLLTCGRLLGLLLAERPASSDTSVTVRRSSPSCTSARAGGPCKTSKRDKCMPAACYSR